MNKQAIDAARVRDHLHHPFISTLFVLYESYILLDKCVLESFTTMVYVGRETDVH